MAMAFCFLMCGSVLLSVSFLCARSIMKRSKLQQNVGDVLILVAGDDNLGFPAMLCWTFGWVFIVLGLLAALSLLPA